MIFLELLQVLLSPGDNPIAVNKYDYYYIYVHENCVLVILYLHSVLPVYNPTLSYLQVGACEAP
jgi:hypothetical protein